MDLEKDNASRPAQDTPKPQDPESTPENTSHAERRKKASPLSIVAFVGSFLGWLSVPAIILGIIDLAKGDKQRHKHGLSIAAIIVGAVMLLSMIGLARIRNAAQEAEAVRPAQSAVQTQQAKTEKPAPTVRATSRPAATSAPAPQKTEPPAAGSSAEEQPMVLRFNAPDQPAAYIESITFDGLGKATLHIAETGLKTEDMSFSLYYCIVRDPGQGPILLTREADGLISGIRQQYPLMQARKDTSFSSLGYGPRFSDTAYARVYPGQYMQFFLIFGDRLDNRIYWTTNLLYIPEEAGAQSLPFELLSYKTLFLDKAFKETGTEYQYSTADDLNRTIRGTSTDRRFWENMTFRPNGSPEAFQAWANGREIVYTPVLYGPDFVLIGADFRTRDLPKDGISQFKLSFPALWDTIQSYSGRDPAGYRAGEYMLIVFIDGALAGGYRINLQ